jgi:4-diphosphocytidyl-2-C-methyl-D-erythritol kinase
MYQVPFTDVLEIVPTTHFSFASSGFPIPGDAANNLCVKAYELLCDRYHIGPVRMHLHKIIPMGGGLGGGSSDAAYVLRGLNDLFALDLPAATLQDLAAELGSDCPLFIQEAPQIARGRGELLETISFSLKGYFVKLVNAGFHVSTREAFAHVSFYTGEAGISTLIQQPIADWKNTLGNSFEVSVFAIHPELEQLKAALYAEGAVYAAMSGSGSTMFGIFREEPELTFSKVDPTVLEFIFPF